MKLSIVIVGVVVGTVVGVVGCVDPTPPPKKKKDPPVEAPQCPAAVVLALGVEGRAQTTPDDVSDDACGAGRAAFFSFTAPSSGEFLVRGAPGIVGPVVTGLWRSDSSCGTATTCSVDNTLLLSLDAGETAALGARAAEQSVGLTVDVVTLVNEGFACDALRRCDAAQGLACLDGACVTTTPTTTCAAPLPMADQAYTTSETGTTQTPASSCVDADAQTAVFTWTAPRTGKMLWASDEGVAVDVRRGGCDGASAACVDGGGSLDVVAGEVIVFIAARHDGDAITLVAGVEEVLAAGGDCNRGFVRCDDGLSCVFSSDPFGAACTEVDGRGTCAQPLPADIGERVLSFLSGQETFFGCFQKFIGFPSAVFSFTAVDDIVLADDGLDDYEVLAGDDCDGVVLKRPCQRRNVGVAAGQTVLLRSRASAETTSFDGELTSLALSALTPLAAGDACAVPAVDADCGAGTLCFRGTCNALLALRGAFLTSSPITAGAAGEHCADGVSATLPRRYELLHLENPSAEVRDVSVTIFFDPETPEVRLASYSAFDPDAPLDNCLDSTTRALSGQSVGLTLEPGGAIDVVFSPFLQAVNFGFDIEVVGDVVVTR